MSDRVRICADEWYIREQRHPGARNESYRWAINDFVKKSFVAQKKRVETFFFCVGAYMRGRVRINIIYE